MSGAGFSFGPGFSLVAGSGGGVPSGPAGGDLGGTYPNPTVISVSHVTTGVLTVPNGGTGAATLTGLVLGNGTSAFTGVTTSAGIAGAISDETGSGSLVFATSPTLVTPIIGVATGTSLALGGATIGTDALGVTGTASISGNTTLGSAVFLGWSTDLFLFRQAANTLAQRNGTAAQAFNLYNTFTDASNYERGVFDWTTTANQLTIGTASAGTGSARAMAFRTSGVDRWFISTAGAFSNSGNSAGASLSISGASSTVPSIIPNRNSTTTGIGAQASGNMSAIVGGVENQRWIAGGVQFLGTIPTVTGTGTPTIVTGSTDTAGEVTSGTLATSVVITFAAAKTNAPFCIVVPQTQIAAFVYTVSTTAITITMTATTGLVIDYHCFQH